MKSINLVGPNEPARVTWLWEWTMNEAIRFAVVPIAIAFTVPFAGA